MTTPSRQRRIPRKHAAGSRLAPSGIARIACHHEAEPPAVRPAHQHAGRLGPHTGRVSEEDPKVQGRDTKSAVGERRALPGLGGGAGRHPVGENNLTEERGRDGEPLVPDREQEEPLRLVPAPPFPPGGDGGEIPGRSPTGWP